MDIFPPPTGEKADDQAERSEQQRTWRRNISAVAVLTLALFLTLALTLTLGLLLRLGLLLIHRLTLRDFLRLRVVDD